jgi:uncharacterized membrane protein
MSCILIGIIAHNKRISYTKENVVGAIAAAFMWPLLTVGYLCGQSLVFMDKLGIFDRNA